MEKPKTSAGDIAHLVVKAGLSAIPIVGSPAAELFSALIVTPLSRRRDEWVESIAEGLKAMEGKIEGFKIESLSQNEMFVTTVMHASQSAIRNHQKEKLEALRNAVLNAALPNAPEEDLQLMFLNYVDTLTSWHLRILKFFDDPKEWGKKNRISYPGWISTPLSNVLLQTFPDLGGRGVHYQFVDDLHARGLMNIDASYLKLGTMENELFAPRTTDLGKQFIKFITSPLV